MPFSVAGDARHSKEIGDMDNSSSHSDVFINQIRRMLYDFRLGFFALLVISSKPPRRPFLAVAMTGASTPPLPLTVKKPSWYKVLHTYAPSSVYINPLAKVGGGLSALTYPPALPSFRSTSTTLATYSVLHSPTYAINSRVFVKQT